MLRVLSILLIAPGLFASYAGRDLVLPVVGRSSGADGRLYDTSVWITNVSKQPASVTLSYYKSAVSNAAPQTSTLQLNAGESRLLGAPEGAGALRIESNRDVTATARTFSRFPNESDARTIGATFNAIPAQFAIGNGESTEVQGIAPGGARYKLYFVEVAGHPIALELELLDPRGARLARNRIYLGAHQQTIADAAQLFPNVAAEHAIVRVSGMNGEGRAIVAGASTANESHDTSAYEMAFKTSSRNRMPRGEVAAYIAIAAAVVVAALKTRRA